MNPHLTARPLKAPPAILIATLGSEAQVVTAALDLLLRQGEPIRQVTVLHSQNTVLHSQAANAPLAAAVERLAQAFEQPPYHLHIPLRLLPLSDAQGRPLQDVDTPLAAQAAFRILYDQVRQARLAGQRVHLCIAGGRKTLALFGMAAAQLLFDEGDCLWHLYSGGEFLDSKRLHPTLGDDVHLIPIPVILWSQVSPVMTGLGQVDDPLEAIERVRRLQLEQRLEHMRAFALGSLTPAEQRAVALLVREGLSDQQIARRLYLSARTVEQHLRSAYLKAAAHWELENVSRTQLVALLNLYFLTTSES